MREHEAKNLLNNTFNQEFKIANFSQFVKELFNEIDIAIEDKTPFIGKQYRDHIADLKKLGEFWDSNRKKIEILAVKLGKPTSLDRARTMQRNFIANWLGKIDAEGALVGFYDDDHLDWRFSFVKMEYSLVRDEEGKVKLAKKLTPAKRYSYLVGINEPNHTCRSQFLNLVKNELSNPTLPDIEQAFSIETVTKEFFEKYKELVIDLKESIEKVVDQDEKIKIEFEDKMIKPIDFAKKLLGQIVFLYFLQKKGWLGVKKGNEWGTGPHNFLRRLFGDKKRDIEPIVSYDNFFNEILEPLFYDALSNPRPGDDGYYVHFHCKIPFLNGGLFEPLNDYDWAGTDILIDNDVFEKILKVFDRFNFTVKEDEPLDKEVAVDPEMLGKVFENLIEVKERKDKGAFYTPREIVHYMCQQSLINYLDTNTDIKREDLETFIQYGDLALEHVIKDLEQQKTYNGQSYVDDEYLIPDSISYNFRKIDRLLKNIKIVDPAVGSGAFPVGMMNEIVKARSILTIYFSGEEQKERTNYNFKRETIAHSLYGVDIDQSGVEIAKLRFWLSLIVDETDMSRIKPLPNLDHKVMCGNSLLEEFEGIKLFDEKLLGAVKKDKQDELKELDEQILDLKDHLSQVKSVEFEKRKSIADEIKRLKRKREKVAKQAATESTEQISLGITESEKKIKTLKALQKRYFNEQNRKSKRKLRSQIDQLEWELIETTLKEQNQEEALEKLERYKRTKVKPFFLWKLYFAEVFQRQNPGFDVVIANPPYVGEKGHKEMFREIKRGFLGKFHQGRVDLFYFFFHLAFEISRDKSQIAFITTNYYPTATSGNKLREDFKERSTVRRLINFNELRIFQSALGQHNMITIVSKENNLNYKAKNCITDRRGLANSDILNSILGWKDKKTKYYEVPQNELYEGDLKYIRLQGTSSESTDETLKVLRKIIDNTQNNLSDFCYIHQGLKTNGDRVTNRHLKLYPQLLENGIKKGEGVFIINKNNKLLKFLNDNEKKFIKPLFKNSDIKSYYTKKVPSEFVIFVTKENYINEVDHPNLINHLNKYKPIIRNRAEVEPEGRIPLYSLTRPRKEYMFPSDKIVAPYKSRGNIFGYNDYEWYASGDVYYINKKRNNQNIKYILSLLNSKLYGVWLYKKGKRKGDLIELYQKPLSEIPIKEISSEKQQPFIDLVDQILSITKDDDYLDNSDKQERVKKLEEKIDSLVYDLYNLTPDEIKIVEDFINEKNKD